MHNYTREDILQLVEEEDVAFIRLQFTDIFGMMKNMAVTVSQLEKALDNRCMFDVSSVEGLSCEEDSDMYLYPDPRTFEIFPWRPQQGKVARLICDVYRPAAIKQLQVNGEKQGVPVFTIEGNQNPVEIAQAGIEYARVNKNNLVIIDTAGRLHIDDRMMTELIEIKDHVDVTQTVLVVDAMTGQDAVNVAKDFNERVGIDGVIITKMDGDTRGGAALSVKAVTGKPILYIGMGEKLEDLQQFHPDRMASRILGMGDVLTLIEKAEASIDEKTAMDMAGKMRRAEFNFNDYLEQMEQVKKMGGMADILNMIPGMSKQLRGVEIDDGMLDKTANIIYSMTKEERENPKIINPSRKRRIANGAGVPIAEVNKLCKNFEESQKMMKQMSGMFGGKKGRRGRKGKFPFPF